jgi:hypothetical protein
MKLPDAIPTKTTAGVGVFLLLGPPIESLVLMSLRDTLFTNMPMSAIAFQVLYNLTSPIFYLFAYLTGIVPALLTWAAIVSLERRTKRVLSMTSVALVGATTVFVLIIPDIAEVLRWGRVGLSSPPPTVWSVAIGTFAGATAALICHAVMHISLQANRSPSTSDLTPPPAGAQP